MKQTLKSKTPAPIWNLARETYQAIRRAPQLPAAYLHPWRRASVRRLAELKDIHKGRRAFVIGNGPSLNQTDLTRLRNEITFGMNRIYLMFPKLGFSTTYLTVVNDLVIEQTVHDLIALNIPKFIAWRSHRHFRNLYPSAFSSFILHPSSFFFLPSSLAFLYTTYASPKFSRDVRGRVWESATVTYVSLQLAFHMGIEQVILIGVDHTSAIQGKPNTTIVSQGDDPNHFSGQYFGKGFRWQLPDFDMSEVGYVMAREAYRSAGREIVDATIGGKLTVFPKADYDSFFK